jgi:hypothetical protein
LIFIFNILLLYNRHRRKNVSCFMRTTEWEESFMN